MVQQIGSGTAKGLIEYLDSLVDKGRAPAGAIGSIKVGFTKILQTVDGKEWGEVNIREIDVADYKTRFANLTLGSYSEDTLRVYAGRMKKAIEWYKTFLSNPGWAPTFKQPGKKVDTAVKVNQKLPTGSAAQTKLSASEQPSAAGQKPDEPPTSNPAADDGLIAYPFPLSTGRLVTLYLPVKLGQSDADRLAAFLQTLVVKEGN